MTNSRQQPIRRRETKDIAQHAPVHVVWEITLACNLKCLHCGSRAGKRRPNELSTAEALDIVRQLAELGTREISLIGGEAYLRKDWLEIAHEINRLGMLCSVQTGARGLSATHIKRARDAGVGGISVSIDGDAVLHDRLRGIPGSYGMALQAVRDIRDSGLNVGVNTQINGESWPLLRDVYKAIRDAGAKSWQVQLTVAMGNAVDNSDILLQPYEILDVAALLYELHGRGAEEGVRVFPGNSIGYFGPYEARWRSLTSAPVHWQGCTAGETTLGLEADGTIKGCPSLTREGYSGGNTRNVTISDAIAALDNRRVSKDGNRGRGFCGSCYYWLACRGGCTWVTDSLTGKRGDNPYCVYRARELAHHGIRETITKVEEAPDKPFAVGRFAIRRETLDGKPAGRKNIRDPRRRSRSRSFIVCEACGEYIAGDEVTCPHCQAGVREAAKKLIFCEMNVRNYFDELQQANDRLIRYLEQINARDTVEEMQSRE